MEAQLERLVQYFGSRPDPSVLALTAEKMSKIRRAFAVTEEEFRAQKSPKEKALLDLVVEHMALLSTQL